MNQDQQLQWVYDKLYGIADGSLRRITIRNLRKMIRIILGNNSILSNVTGSNLNRNINTQGIYGISVQLILPVNSERERQNVRNRWISAARDAIVIYSNSNSFGNNTNNNTTTINSKRSSGTKLSTPTRKRLKKTPTTPQSKLRKSPKK